MDSELLVAALHRAGFELKWIRVDDEASYREQLTREWDVVLSDHELPRFSSTRALEIVNELGIKTPFIIVSGTIGEEIAVRSIKHGAADYLLKDRLARIGPAIQQAMAQARHRAEQEEAKAAIRESEERFQQFAANIPEVLWMKDVKTGRYLYISPAFEKVWGRPAEQIVENPDVCMEFIAPEDRAEVAAAESRHPTGEFDLTYRIIRPNGEVRCIRNRAFGVRNAAGEIYRIAGVAEDITESRAAEERLQHQAAMLEMAKDAIIVRDFQSERITYWNKGAERIYGWTAEEALEQRIGELLCMDPALPARISQELQEKDEWYGETRHITKAGKKLVVNIRATLIRDADGQPQGVLSITADVTEQRKLEAQFLRAQRMESIGTLASGVAHDLNNILAPIMMSVPLLRGPLTPESREGIITTIEMSAERGAQIVKQVLAFGRGLEGERKPMSLRASISELTKIMRETFPKDIRVESSTASDLWLVTGDPTQIHQILLNLCVNARDAMPMGGRLRLAVSNLDVDANYAATVNDVKPGRYVLVEVQDDGSGIPPEIVERIFDPFFTTKGVGKGTGLGLSTVLGIVKSHGGAVHVNTEVGKGTTFYVYLPAAAEEAVAAAGQSALENIPQGNGEVILVVDDEATIRSAAKTVLNAHGYKVLTASDGTEALAVVASQPSTAAVITDLMMPYMDGVALARALRKMQPNLPIAASTGLGDRPQLSELKTLGVTNLLNKPYSAESLLKVAYELVQLQRPAEQPQSSASPSS